MKGIDWGFLYNRYKDKVFDTGWLESETARLLLDDDVTIGAEFGNADSAITADDFLLFIYGESVFLVKFKDFWEIFFTDFLFKNGDFHVTVD